jgi:hypothetical protein
VLVVNPPGFMTPVLWKSPSIHEDSPKEVPGRAIPILRQRQPTGRGPALTR